MLPVGYRDSENDWLILLKLEKQRRLGYFDWLNSNFHNIIEAKRFEIYSNLSFPRLVVC
jgi:hypothetical protein